MAYLGVRGNGSKKKPLTDDLIKRIDSFLKGTYEGYVGFYYIGSNEVMVCLAEKPACVLTIAEIKEQIEKKATELLKKKHTG